MKPPIKLSYGVSNFEKIVKQGFYYVDQTAYIELLEEQPDSTFFFLRPRRFGKSLFVSILHYYYGLEHQSKFQQLFGNYYIGQNPTPLANQYMVLKFEFTKITTDSKDSTYQGFLERVRTGATRFFDAYSNVFSAAERKNALQKKVPADIMEELITLMLRKAPNRHLYVLIDEYDHFANELIAFRLEDFKDFVSKGGFVRKFYEAIKEGTQLGVVDRFFATGVTPITLDSMTSGFNIATNLSLDLHFVEMMGFSSGNVVNLFRLANPKQADEIASILPLMKDWYNGYLFNEELGAEHKLYNPNMVLYFLKNFQRQGKAPKVMLDTNIASDYHKVRRLMMIENPTQNRLLLDKIIEGEELEGVITREFSFAKKFTEHDFMSLLFYNGFLTIDHALGNILYFRVPNYVVQKLYFDYFREILQENEAVDVQTGKITSAIASMAFKGNPQLFFDLIHTTLHQLADRDYQKFDEKYAKIIMITYMMLTNTFFMQSERETPAGYLDLSFLESPNIPLFHQYIFELKYLKKANSKELKSKQEKAKKQLLGYIDESVKFKNMDNLQAWTVVVVKDVLEVERVR